MNLGETWNDWAVKFIAAKEAWDVHKELHLNSQPRDWETMDLGFQRFIGHAYNRSEFSKMLEALMPFLMTSGGIDQILVETEEDREKKLMEVIRLKKELQYWIDWKRDYWD